MAGPQQALSRHEFVILVAMMISIVAMATDLMLPALGVIGHDLVVADPNDAQLVVTAFFLGLAVGQLLAGPLSDSFGRKPVIYIGYGIFLLGCLLSMLTTNWTLMLLGRVLQGVGASAPRIVTVALVRDGYEGRAMAQIMSVVMAVFILVPMIAPSIGQALIYLAGWRSPFACLFVLGMVSCTWFLLRQPETLPPGKRRPFKLSFLITGVVEICRNRTALGYTLVTGLVNGAFLGYLSSAMQIFRTTFKVGDLFAMYFAVAALAIGFASFVNSHLVQKFGMRRLTRLSLVLCSMLSFGFLSLIWLFTPEPSLLLFMTWLLPVFFFVGIMFGNLNALAMEPLGHMAGLGSAFVGSLSTFIALPLAWLIGQRFEGSVTPLVLGFAILSLASLLVVAWVERDLSLNTKLNPRVK